MIVQWPSLPLRVTCSAFLLFVTACQASPNVSAPAQVSPQEDTVSLSLPSGCPPSFGISSTLRDEPYISSQEGLNCFAWQTFIALNWPADPNNNGQPNATGAFGDPTDLSPTVWQTYKAAQDVFLPGAKPPADWNVNNSPPSACAAKISAAGLSQPSIFYMTAKSSSVVLQDEVEATTDQILVDQTGNLIHFEKRINEVEFKYIWNNHLYNGDQQALTARNTGIILPPGSIEVKAAWRLLDGEPKNIQARYKKTMAFSYDASTNTCYGPFTMGLIALHIIRKTGTMPAVMWSTFEQVDNVPLDTLAGINFPYPTPTFTLNNPACGDAQCPWNATPQPTPTPPAIPTYEPVQVHRMTPIPNDVVSLSQDVQKLIFNANPASVWQYYQLINVLWPNTNTPIDPATKGALTPLSISSSHFESTDGDKVNNAALETYVQNSTCTDCHVFAGIAASTAVGCSPNLASDFSFVFDDADTMDHWRATNCKTPTPTP